ncbi:MAG: bifunctional adenosylcobinamide kinase/adenosylcobinamide-phosphate guanylyltransferase, partial [Chloroflexi bacterium]|nr:bifunctional adenosylcobinamide kinase/adenosylcobinamide-phosphate guanylyltransferase [Chloroflexota bacterium]
LEERAMASLSQLLQVWRSSQTALFLVSGEVGLSLVPPNPLGRRFQDLLGLVNQKMADAADRVYLVVSGIPIEIKGEIKGSNPGIEIP